MKFKGFVGAMSEKNPTVGYKPIFINSNWTSQVYQTNLFQEQSRGAPESHSILPCCMNHLYKTAQALQLYKQQKVSTDRRQEVDD
jgi:hypothetical protein